jgi:hypothetical protein
VAINYPSQIAVQVIHEGGSASNYVDKITIFEGNTQVGEKEFAGPSGQEMTMETVTVVLRGLGPLKAVAHAIADGDGESRAYPERVDGDFVYFDEALPGELVTPFGSPPQGTQTPAQQYTPPPASSSTPPQQQGTVTPYRPAPQQDNTMFYVSGAVLVLVVAGLAYYFGVVKKKQ